MIIHVTNVSTGCAYQWVFDDMMCSKVDKCQRLKIIYTLVDVKKVKGGKIKCNSIQEYTSCCV